MSLAPSDWSVVVVGRWNRAILTPAGIGKRIFKLPEGTPLEVMIAIDAIAPPLVKHDKMVVVTASDRLTVQPEIHRFDEMIRACDLASNAVKSLPETPLIAVGFNVKYTTQGYVEAIDRALASEIDDRASDAQYKIIERQVHRAYEWKTGKLNVVVTLADNETRSIALNFELQSDSREKHLDWLASTSPPLLVEVQKVIGSILQITPEEITYEQANQSNDHT